MIDQILVDTNAVVDFLRANRDVPPPLQSVHKVLLPLHVLGELETGALLSAMQAENAQAIEELLMEWTLLLPDRATAFHYAKLCYADEVRQRSSARLERARKNDL